MLSREMGDSAEEARGAEDTRSDAAGDGCREGGRAGDWCREGGSGVRDLSNIGFAKTVASGDESQGRSDRRVRGRARRWMRSGTTDRCTAGFGAAAGGGQIDEEDGGGL